MSPDCKGNMSVHQLQFHLSRNFACMAARRRIMERCFRGGDDIHKGKLEEVQGTINHCYDLLRKLGASK